MEKIEKTKIKFFAAIMIMTFLITITAIMTPVSARAGEISGPGSPDGSQGTYWWYRDNKWTSNNQFWGNRGHLKLKAEKTYTFEWRGIDDSGITENPKDAWQVFVMDAGKGSHGWEQVILQVRDDEAWTGDDLVIRAFVNWDIGLGQVLVPQGILDLRLVLRQNTEDDRWHIEAWYNIGDGWNQFVDADDVDISTSWSGLPGNPTQACAGIQIDKDSDGTLYFHPAAP